MRYRQMADFRHNLAGGDIFQLPDFGSLCHDIQMWADKSYATTVLTFCAATNVVCPVADLTYLIYQACRD